MFVFYYQVLTATPLQFICKSLLDWSTDARRMCGIELHVLSSCIFWRCIYLMRYIVGRPIANVGNAWACDIIAWPYALRFLIHIVFLLVKPCPQWRRKRQLSQKTATVAVFGDKLSPISATIVASVDRLFLLFVNYLFGNVCVSIVLLTQQGLYFEPRPDPAHA